MMNIAIYFSNRSIKTVDCSDVMSGNPGIGGTEYAMLMLACSLEQNYKDLNLTVYVNEKGLLPSMLKIKQVNEWNDLAQKMTDDRISALLIIHDESLRKNRIPEIFPDDLKLIILTQTFASTKELSYYAKNKSVSRIVCVGYEQLDLYRDHAAFLKSTAIYNGINTAGWKKQSETTIPYDKRPLNVTYIGSLKPQKGFHLLAKAWPQIIKACPNAFLNVIGSGKLYDRNECLGKYGIADSEYEAVFMPYLLDVNGNVLPSVKFWGILGHEKGEILQKTRVGVPNPSGKSETFGYTAVEMQLFGTLVTTIKCPAYLETVHPLSGILYEDEKELAKSVIFLLNRDENHYTEAIDFIDSNFSIDKIAEEWHQLFLEVINDKPYLIAPIRANKNYRLKQWKEINRKIKNFLPFGYAILPSIYFFEDLFLKLKGLLKREHLIKYIFYKYIYKK
jgi:glycosyltransferase involved in cell wall biosynthesis